ncbi:MAG TPA: tripartite tricarboxylate transporter substrate binding protein [Chondromyces sp.]|nr:tripartite tricarboxylate transporter substrate binding protein [Chondromyces sp.]
MRMGLRRLTASLLFLFLLNGCNIEEADEKATYPHNKIEIIAPSDPGGGWDTTARALKSILTKEGLVQQEIEVLNKPGAGGETGWEYTKNSNSHTLAVNSSLMITNHLLGQSQLVYEDFTPIAILASEWQAITVPKESDIKTAIQLMEMLKKDPKKLKIGVAPGLGNDDQLSFTMIAKKYGIDPKDLQFYVYDSGSEVAKALFDRQIDIATMSVSEAEKHKKTGMMDILAVSSEKRLDKLKDVPTWKEQGINFVFPHWRGLMGPPGMTEEEVEFWNSQIKKMIETDEWKAVLKENGWDSFYHDSRETKVFLEKQNRMYNELLNESGSITKQQD